jgi:hypothetical protein
MEEDDTRSTFLLHFIDPCKESGHVFIHFYKTNISSFFVASFVRYTKTLFWVIRLKKIRANDREYKH